MRGSEVREAQGERRKLQVHNSVYDKLQKDEFQGFPSHSVKDRGSEARWRSE